MPPFRLFFGLFVSLCLGLAPAAAASYRWGNVAIHGGGFVSGLLFHPKTNGVFYARTDVGGAFRWDPTSATWTPLNDSISRNDSQLTGIISFALDPNDDQRLYLAAGQYLPSWARTAALLRSTDRGRTWSQVELPFKLGGNSDGRSTGERLQVDPNLGRILFLGTNENGLWSSGDHGATWSRVTSFPATSITAVAFDAGSGTSGQATPRLYVGAVNKTGSSLYLSTDGGLSWSVVAGQPTNLHIHRMSVDSAGTLFSTWTDNLGPNGINAGAVWRTTRGGTWTNITPPTGQGGFAGLSIAANQANTIAVTTLNRWSPGDTVYRSTDGGTTWTAVLNRNLLDHSEAPWAAASSPHWLGDVQINPFDANEAWFITGYGVFQTQNLQQSNAASVSWRFRNRGLEETVPLALVSPQQGALLLSSIGDIDGFRHTSLDTPPTSRLAPLAGTSRSIDLAGTEDQIAIRLSDSNGYSSLDQGATWTAFPTKPATTNGTGRVTVNADGSVFLWTPTNSAPFRSTNRGSSWASTTGLPSATSAEWNPVADRVNKDRVALYHRAGGSVYTSTDGGATWSLGATGLPNDEGSLKAVPGKEGHLWLAIAYQGLFRSTDGGRSFTRVTAFTQAFRVGLGRAATPGGYPAIYADGRVSGVHGIFRSDDEGATWVRINDDLHQYGWINDISGDPKTYGRVYLATGGRGIVYGDLITTAAPTISRHPRTTTLPAGSSLSLTVEASGEPPLSYQWFKDGVAISGATQPTLALASIQSSNTARYTVNVTNAGGTVTSRPATLRVETPTPSRIANLAVRTEAGRNNQALIVGFYMEGGPKEVLVRGIGPRLSFFNLSEFMADPKVTFFTQSGVEISSNDNWGDAGAGPSMRTLFSQVGAFDLEDGSRDAALRVTAEGQHSVHLRAASGASVGTALVELYDASTGTTRRLRNVSALNYAGKNEQSLIAGFVILGSEPKEVLIRAVGPGLGVAPFNVSGFIPDPKLELAEYINGKFIPIAENDNWASETSAGDAFKQAGAFSLPAGSRDAAILIHLSEGNYSASVLSADGAYGTGIVEVYEVIR